MSFSHSLSEFVCLSDLYVSDVCAEGVPNAALLAEYPSSNSSETQFRNTSQFIIHDPYPPPARELLKILGPHHFMCGWGDRISVSSEIQPPNVLTQHWEDMLGQPGHVRWKSFDLESRYITLFPFESIPAEKQVVDPKVLYRLHSKETIAKIDCPQAGVLDEPRIPCIIKLSHGYAGTGNYFIQSQGDLIEAQQKIKKNWPGSVTVINELVGDIANDYCVQFYVDLTGAVTWLGVTEQLFSQDKRWQGGTFIGKQQDLLYSQLAAIVDTVASYLYQSGYFGVVGVDILRDKKGQLFLVDLNPRLNGSTPFLHASRQFLRQGYTEGVYVPSVSLSGTLEEVIAKAEDIKGAKVMIQSAYELSDKKQTTCHVSINASSLKRCYEILNSLN
ncbi:MAG: ATP-grasp domain-containing protein [Pseudomonadales bacterium]|nr:ATP-grasp domain-containing protein [Pseudomonadales bacterium]